MPTMMKRRCSRGDTEALYAASSSIAHIKSLILNTHVTDCPVCREKLAVMNVVQAVGR